MKLLLQFLQIHGKQEVVKTLEFEICTKEDFEFDVYGLIQQHLNINPYNLILVTIDNEIVFKNPHLLVRASC